jgi:hypothetical protein
VDRTRVFRSPPWQIPGVFGIPFQEIIDDGRDFKLVRCHGVPLQTKAAQTQGRIDPRQIPDRSGLQTSSNRMTATDKPTKSAGIIVIPWPFDFTDGGSESEHEAMNTFENQIDSIPIRVNDFNVNQANRGSKPCCLGLDLGG